LSTRPRRPGPRPASSFHRGAATSRWRAPASRPETRCVRCTRRPPMGSAPWHSSSAGTPPCVAR
jgi:hypothetical protein